MIRRPMFCLLSLLWGVGIPATLAAAEPIASLPQRLDSAVATALVPPLKPEDRIPGAPNPYVVAPGDTLWSIAARFLKNPQNWPDIWEGNAQIANPHWIYPGDKVFFSIDADGRPRLGLSPPTNEGALAADGDDALKPEIKISPPVRRETAVTDHDRETIRLFMRRNSFITADNITGDGYILGDLAAHENLAQGNQVLIRFSKPVQPGDALAIYRPGAALSDPKSGEAMGRLAHHMGLLQVERLTPEGPVARITQAFMDISPGDRLMVPHGVNMDFELQPEPHVALQGRVLHIQGDVDEAGTRQVIVVGVGRRDRATQGLVLPVYKKGGKVLDPEPNPDAWAFGKREVSLPSEVIGAAIVFYVGEKASHALLKNATRSVNRGDWVAVSPVPPP
ncbi:MAG: LysM peptidoglycan-binding domain-containing protein [Magnetococcales bacterium]|nr:LysM peptidoglycan-binding domain-containing protein [Magnetococcales bacterium]